MAQIISDAPADGKRTGKVKTEKPPEEPQLLLTSDVDGAVSEPVQKTEPVEKPEPDEALQELKRQLEAERNARLQAEQARVQAERQAMSAKTETEDTNLRLVQNAIETVKANQSSLKQQYAQAASVNDWNTVADLQEQMALNGARLLQLENGKQAMEEAAKRPKEQPRQDPVEALASRLTPRSAAWVRAHPEYARDPVLYRKMIAAHELSAPDNAIDSDGYFAAVEKALGIRATPQPSEDDDEEAMSAAATPVQRRTSPPAAPVSRANLSSGNTNPRKVRLTPEQVEIAEHSKMTPQEYWEQLQKARERGEVH